MNDAVKVEKERAMRRYRRLRQAAALSRCLLEAVAALVILSWFSARLPGALALCAELRRLPSLLLRPVCAFVVGNAIILALIAKASKPGGATGDPRPPSSPLPSATAAPVAAAPPVKEMPEAAFRLRRSKSGKVRPVARKDGLERALRRSETNVRRRREVARTWWAEGEEVRIGEVSAADDNERFRQKIEAFIAKQLEFIKREEAFLLLAGHATAGAAALLVAGDSRP